jgi:DnaK suppressor protein
MKNRSPEVAGRLTSLRSTLLLRVGFVPQLNSQLINQGCVMEKTKTRAAKKTKHRSRIRPKTASQDVLSPPQHPVKINPKWQPHYRRLKELHDFFVRQKGVLAQDANEEQPTYSEHMADAGTDSYDRDFALSMLSSNQDALYEIDAAIRRIETGTYGICEVTGKPIPLKRLEAIPWARYTVEAEKQLEQRGAVNRAHLGDLGSLTEGESASEESEERETGEEHS